MTRGRSRRRSIARSPNARARSSHETKNADTDDHPATCADDAPPPPSRRDGGARGAARCAQRAAAARGRRRSSCIPRSQRTLPRRRDAIHNGGIDWGHAEALAFAALLAEGHDVRLTGQDAERGTFSHRQAVLHDANTGETYTPLAHSAAGDAATFEIYNSPLSETAVLGFEYGFSIAAPDDAGAVGGAVRRLRQRRAADRRPVPRRRPREVGAGLGRRAPAAARLRGQGPEHSSARLERFLQLCAEGNMRRRVSVHAGAVLPHPAPPGAATPQRPLVLMQPKSLLRLPAAASQLEDLATGTFRPVIDDPIASRASRGGAALVFCTGKIYYDLIEKRAARRTSRSCASRSSIPWPQDVARDRRLVSERGRSRLGAGGAEEHGRVDATSRRGSARTSGRCCRCGTSGGRSARAPRRDTTRRIMQEQARIVTRGARRYRRRRERTKGRCAVSRYGGWCAEGLVASRLGSPSASAGLSLTTARSHQHIP